MKACAVAAAVACAGGGLIVDHVGSASATNTGTAAPVSLDHYLCANVFGHGGCDPVTVSLPDGTTFGISNPDTRFTCGDGRHGGQDQPPAPASVTNEFTTTPVALTERRETFGCSLLPAVQFGNARPQAVAAALVTFTCAWVHYPSLTSTRFMPPLPVTVADHLSLRVLDPTVLCVPTGATVGASSMDLVCFAARDVTAPRRFFFAPEFGLCVPSSPAGDPGPSSTTTTMDPPSTAATSTTTTTAPPPSSTTTHPTSTTKPPPPPTSTSTTTSTTTSTSTSTSTTTTTQPPPSTTTTTTSGTQPCTGVVIGGKCIGNE